MLIFTLYLVIVSCDHSAINDADDYVVIMIIIIMIVVLSDNGDDIKYTVVMNVMKTTLFRPPSILAFHLV